VRVLGIDEAGRGCVFGDLYVAGFVAEPYEPDALRAVGATDSKRLSAKRRVAAREALSEMGTVDVRRITPAQIDDGNLNHLELEVLLDLIITHRPDHVIIDALGHPSTLPKTMDQLLSALVPHGLAPKITMEPKADLNHPVVGAASIFAKTDRDDQLDALKLEHGELGSGYPSDPKVKNWLASHAATHTPWPSFVRTRWETVRRFEQLRLA